jgi:hypothetical protein
MTFRLVISLVAVALTLAAQPPKPKNWTVPRTPDGHPDLQGIWTNATLTPMERPETFGGKATVTDEEARVYERKDLASNDIDREDSPLLARINGANAVGGYNNLFIDRGSELARVDGVKRTSLVVDPPDGKVPPLTPDARKRLAAGARNYDRYDAVKDRPISERCIVGFGSTSGPPMVPALYNSNYQIVETPDAIMILVEMVHDVRVIRMNATHISAGIHKWLGDSIGHWEGDTLVVDTTNFNDQTAFRGSTQSLHIVERFTRVGANTILYKATMDDPATFTRSWTMQYPFAAATGPIYEYACHEGNYAMPDILGGARKADGAASAK